VALQFVVEVGHRRKGRHRIHAAAADSVAGGVWLSPSVQSLGLLDAGALWLRSELNAPGRREAGPL
jgi:hypothetical protein